MLSVIDRSFPSFDPNYLGRAGTSRAIVEIIEYRWPEPQQQIYCDPRHRIDMVLSHRPPAATGRFLEDNFGPNRIGRLIFLPSGVTMESQWQAGEQRSVCCVFDPELLGGEAGPAKAPQHALDLSNPFVRSVMDRLGNEALAPGFASGLMVESLCQAMFVDLHRALEPPVGSILSASEMKAVNEMLLTDGRIVQIKEISDLLGMSSRHFARLFRATTGRSVGAYAAGQRAKRAEALLADRRLMI